MEKEYVPLWLMNISDFPPKKGTELAICEPMCGVSVSDDHKDGVGHVKNCQLTWESFMKGLDATQKKTLYNLLCEFSSQDSSDLGSTELV